MTRKMVAEPQPISASVLLAEGLHSRSPARRVAYILSIGVVANVAAWNSYWHMAAVAVLGHQDPFLAYSLPLSVDGMLIVATLAIAEDKANGRRARGWARFAFRLGATVSVAANVASVVVDHGLDPLSIAVSGWPPVCLLVVVEVMARPGKPRRNRTPSTRDDRAPEPGPRPTHGLADPAHSSNGGGGPRTSSADEATITSSDLADLRPIARAARDAVAGQGLPLTRDTLAAHLRSEGHPMRNARVSTLLHALRQDDELVSPAERRTSDEA